MSKSTFKILFYLTYIIHSGFISGYQNRYGDNLKPDNLMLGENGRLYLIDLGGAVQ